MFYSVSVSFHRDFLEVKDDHIEIGVMARPQKGEANTEIIKKIANHFKVPKSSVRLVSGEKSRNKIVQVTGLDYENKI
ncbi:MAG TPA: DUF167 domain-containing protein [Candidatus Nitrosotalea sp.]|nr:DUF167 domain-containing protein [Candidatus Nitrosotalea sp.]